MQKLIAQYKDRPDVLFLSLNMDENPGLIAPFLTSNKLSMTVLPAFTFVTQTLKVDGIPQNWIVDSNGVIKLKGVGYDSTERWETGMKNAIDKVASSGPATASSGSGR